MELARKITRPLSAMIVCQISDFRHESPPPCSAQVHVRAYTNRGDVYGRKGDLDRALADHSKAIALDPKSARAYNNRCWLRATSGRDLPLALADCDESLRLRPDDAATLDSRGLVFLLLNRLDEAIADYDASLKIRAKVAGSLYGRGIAKQRKGDQAGAAQDIAEARAIQADVADEFAKWGVK